MTKLEKWLSSAGITVGLAIIMIGGISAVRMTSDIRQMYAEAAVVDKEVAACQPAHRAVAAAPVAPAR